MIISILFPLLLVFSPACSYKILVYSSKFGYSHMNFLGSMADTLHRAGHDVTVLQPVLDPKVRGTGVEVAKVVTIEPSQKMDEALKTDFEDPEMWKMIWTINTKNPLGVVLLAPKLAKGFGLSLENTMAHTEVLDSLKKEKFDLGIVEMFDYSGFPIFYELGITNILGSHSTVLTDRTSYSVGLPLLPSFIPPMQSSAGDDGSFWSRLSNIVFTIASWIFEYYAESPAQAYMDKYHPNAPKIQEIVSNMSFIFTNCEPLLDFPRPKFYKIIDIGGIGLKPVKNLTDDWIALLSKRKRNVLMSFGSVAPSFQMPQEYKDNILKVLGEFKDVTFIWKYETPEDGVLQAVENVHITKWTPQSDLLASGKLDLFITHGGAGSLLESATANVPMIVIPLFGDQHRNAIMAERHKFAIIYEKNDLASYSKLKSVIERALDDKKIKEAAERTSGILASRPFTPQELLVKHVELAAKFGSIPNLTPTGRKFSFVQYHNIDVFFLVGVIVFMIVIAIAYIVKKCLSSGTPTKEKKQ